jgi:hypothetical protein
MRQEHRYERREFCQGQRGTGFAGPLVAPPSGGGAEGTSGGLP